MTEKGTVEIGRDLERVKASLGHGHFLRWIEAEFGMSPASALRFIQVALRFGDKFITVTHLPSAVLYTLAAPSTDDAVVDEVLERVAEGETDLARFTQRRKEAYEALHPQTKHGGDRKSGSSRQLGDSIRRPLYGRYCCCDVDRAKSAKAAKVATMRSTPSFGR